MQVASTQQIVYADSVVGGAFPPYPLPSSLRLNLARIPIPEGRCMTRKTAWASFVLAVALCVLSTACKDTKTLQENEQLKAQVADLQKQVGEMGNNLETVTADRDNLKKENEALKAQMNARKSKKARKKTSRRKRPQA
jgi:septal ring factor EnvC (AmiA/AmiB activator)